MEASSNAPFFVDTEVIRLTKNGVWMSDQTEITHEPTRQMFARNLERIPGHERHYQIKVSHESKAIEIEDTPYFVQRIDGNLESGFEILLNDGIREKLNFQSLKYQPERLTCTIERKEYPEEAKFLSSAYMDLLSHLREDDSSYFLEGKNGSASKIRAILKMK